jgi:ABC-type transport system involved in multi-copper enzyme maturation permease subunit
MASLLDWCRRNLGWSNTQQAWEQRLALLFFAAAVMGLTRWRMQLPLWWQLIAWAGLLTVAAILFRQGLLKLFGPVLFYDLVRIARRTRYILLRTLYAILLAVLLFWVYATWYLGAPQGRIEASRMALFAESFFYTFMVIQFLTVIVLTPAYTAGAIAEEKDRKTLEFLLATDLYNREIVLSKLLSRVANLTLIVLAGLPILSFLQFMGGVDPNLVLAGFAATAMTMFSLAGLSILYSVWYKRPRDAIVMTYLTSATYLLLSLGAWILMIVPLGIATWPSTSTWSSPITLGEVVEWLNSGNIVTAVSLLAYRLAGNRYLEETLPEVLRDYAVFHGLVFAACTGWAILRLRVVAMQETYGKAKKEPLLVRMQVRPRVGQFPMIWKEVFAEPGFRFNVFSRIVLGVLVLGTFVPAIIMLAIALDEVFGIWGRVRWGRVGSIFEWLPAAMNIWARIVGTLVACLMLLAVVVRASGSISGERDKQTLDALYTTPLSSDAMLLAKALGCILSVRWAWLWLGAIWGLTVVCQGYNVVCLPILVFAWFTYAAFLTCLGLWFSMVCRTTMRANLWAMLTTILAGLGHWLIWMCCIPVFTFAEDELGQAFFDLLEWVAKVQVGLTPPLALGWYLPFRMEEFTEANADRHASELLLGGIGICFWGLAALAMWMAISRRFRVLSNRLPFRPAGYVAPANGAVTVKPVVTQPPTEVTPSGPN